MPRSNILSALLLIAAVALSFTNVPAHANLSQTPHTEREEITPLVEIGDALTGSGPTVGPYTGPQQTAALLSQVDGPGRDLVAITRRIKLHGSGTIPPMVHASPPDYAVGTRQQFYIADLVKKNYYSASATLKVITPHAYWYVKDGYSVNLAALRASATYFDEHIYPTDRRIFGSEASPGIDNDPHITVLLTPMSGLNGYFSSSDSYSKVINPFSNERKMIYISSQPRNPSGSPGNAFEATLAHEFQHMIHWNVQPNKDVWLDEGCSEIAMRVNGYNPGGFDYIFSSQPDTQLNAWAASPGESAAHYGASYLFLRYLMDRYGGEQFISNLMKQTGLGIAAIDSSVKQAGNQAGFEGAFKDWTVANILNNSSIAGGRYSYAEGGRAKITRLLQNYPATRSDTIHQFATEYIKLSGNLGPATISFKGSSTAKVVTADPHSGQGFWYSNRRDTGDTTLTREIDLTHTSKATLQFWTWYDIENTFDYAYLEVSTDSGRSWTPQKGKYTTTANPNGQSFGAAWTGKSGVSATSSSPAKWVQEAIDLSQHAGKKVQIRFEYITDEGYNAPGLVVDDLKVPETGYSDNAETDNGWDEQGFVRIGNTIPQRWYVALIENGQAPRVREMVVQDNGSGTLDIDGLGQGRAWRDATLVIAPLAPKTTVTASYSLTIRKK